jgi:hypothetical protein
VGPTSTLAVYGSLQNVPSWVRDEKPSSPQKFQSRGEGASCFPYNFLPLLTVVFSSFFALHTVIHPRAVTEFSYRYHGDDKVAQIYLSFNLNATTPASRAGEIADTLARLKEDGMQGRDISDDELAKSHARYLVGGKHDVPHERIFRFGRRFAIFPRFAVQWHCLQSFRKGQARCAHSCLGCILR